MSGVLATAEPELAPYYSHQYELYELASHKLVYDGKNKAWDGTVVICNCRTGYPLELRLKDLAPYRPVFPTLELAA